MEGASPAVFTLQLAWESQREDGATIADTMDALEETVDLGAQGLSVGTGTKDDDDTCTQTPPLRQWCPGLHASRPDGVFMSKLSLAWGC